MSGSVGQPPAQSREAVLRLQGVQFAYGDLSVLQDVNIAIHERDFASIVGPNGGGKTTLLKLLVGLLQPRAGTVEVFGVAPQKARGRIGYMPQHSQLDAQFPVCVLDVAMMGRLGITRPLGPYTREDRDVTRRALADVGLVEMERRPFSALSGGQRQRVLIARALSCEPDLLLLDEPTASLDLRVQDDLYELLGRLSEKLTVVLVSHDVGFVSKFVKTVICVNRTVHVHSSRDLSKEAIIQLYGRDVRLLHHEHQGPCTHT
ncbi:MAG: ABC transporter [Planctomycetota bacterium]|nr:MAG: ABC transporter [Planctomycetota bacterium]